MVSLMNGLWDQSSNQAQVPASDTSILTARKPSEGLRIPDQAPLWKLRCVTGLDSTNSLGSIPQNDDEEPTRPSLFSTKPFPLRFYAPNHSPLPKSPTLRHRILHCVPEVTDYQRGNYDQHHRDREHNHHHHEHNHDHHNHYSNDGAELSGPKRVVVKFAKAIGWMDLANFLREHLLLRCRAAALFFAAAACPYLLPKHAVKPVQNAFILVTFPLVGLKKFLPALKS
ncbi:probable cadmium/zinc-transporting ATPase HMA1, chloroplastic [Tripterygium wilfordii]|uniref:probable cadmium/zinc-transporting ATPase HMA1, chloroplastic n=1 Tax=Tripterygium wilfordii TaxID=458696 RepID=UPI0018F83C2A|nr:probable cadmium/zinc-transporting ATPase HMA1, chloroplastic [Tripterygium wilfordii]